MDAMVSPPWRAYPGGAMFVLYVLRRGRRMQQTSHDIPHPAQVAGSAVRSG